MNTTTISIKIDKNSIIPIYHQLYAALLEMIEDGTFKSHDRLPSENELNSYFDISRNTAQKSLQLLVDQGYAYRIQGKGTFVSDSMVTYSVTASLSFSAEIIGLKKVPESKLLHAKEIESTGHIIKNLQIKKGDPVYSIQRIRYVDKKPMALQTSFLPGNLVPGLINYKFEEDSLFKTIKKYFGHNVSSASELLKTAKCDGYEAKLLKIKEGDAVFLLERVTKLADGKILEFVKTVLRGDKSSFSIELSNFQNNR
jgi:GntR family transcriptional regulator